MATPRLDQAQALVQRIREALDAAALEKVLATTDAGAIPSGLRHGVVVVEVPAITWPSFYDTDVVWELGVVAGPPDNVAAAWATLDAILSALERAQLPLDRAEPGGYPLKGFPACPAYVVTLSSQTIPIPLTE